MPRPTINDVAAAAGVSKGAVSFALNDRPGLAPHTRRRILDAAEELGWSPSPRARALSVSKALAVGLIVARPPEILRADAFFPSFIAGLETVLSRRGHALLLQVAELDDAAAYRRLAQEGRVDGVFLTDLQIDDERPALLEELGLPAVIVGPALGQVAEGARQSALGVDDAPGVAAAVRHLVELGHRRIAHVSGPLTMVHGSSRRLAWSTRAARGRAARRPLRRGRLLRRVRSGRHPTAARPRHPADRDRLRQRPDGDGRAVACRVPRRRRPRRAVDDRVRRHGDLRTPAALAHHGEHRRRGVGPRRRHPTAPAHRPGAPDPGRPPGRPPRGARLDRTSTRSSTVLLHDAQPPKEHSPHEIQTPVRVRRRPRPGPHRSLRWRLRLR